MSKQFTGKSNTIRKRRSEKLSPIEHQAFKKHVDGFDTQLDAVEALGFKSRQTLRNIYILGSGNPENIQKIRKAVKELVA